MLSVLLADGCAHPRNVSAKRRRVRLSPLELEKWLQAHGFQTRRGKGRQALHLYLEGDGALAVAPRISTIYSPRPGLLEINGFG